MEPNQYLSAFLESQDVKNDGAEIKDLKLRQTEVESLLKKYFNESNPTIIPGGSMAKDTMVKDSYDLDLICYFENGDTKPGTNLEEIYNNARKALEPNFLVFPKTSALRLKAKDNKSDFHIDVVPGRFIDETKTDAFLFQSGADKDRLRTNLQVHINHIKTSGQKKMIQLAKIWNIRSQVFLKTFVLELLVIEVMKKVGGKQGLAEQFKAFLEYVRDHIHSITIEDPANPTGNDLSAAFNEAIKGNLQAISSITLQTIEQRGWEQIFVNDQVPAVDERTAAIQKIAKQTSDFPKPWSK